MSAVRMSPEFALVEEPEGPEVELILSAMDAGRGAGWRSIRAATAGASAAPPLRLASTETAAAPVERRRARRVSHRVRAELRLFADAPGTPPRVLFTRDADPRGVGFITRHPVPLGYGGWLELLAPDGDPLKVSVTLFRCRETIGGWYEGALHFNKRQARMSG